MELHQDIPEALKAAAAAMAAQLPGADRQVFRVFGDINLAGRFGYRVLAADDQRLYYGSLDGNGSAPGPVQNILLGEIRDVRIVNHVGNSSLIIDRADDSLEVARFSLSQAGAFETALRKLVDLASVQDGRSAESLASANESLNFVRKQPHCPNCGRAISLRAEICLHCTDRRRLVIRLFSLLKPYVKPVTLTMSLTLMATLLGLVPAWLNKAVFDRAILPRDMGMLLKLMAGYAGCHVAGALLGSARMRLMGWLGQRVVFDLRMRAFDQLQRLSLRYYESKQTGRLMTRVTTDTDRIERFVVEGLQDLVIDSLTILIIVGMMLYMNARLTLIALLPVPVVFLMVWFFSKRIKTLYRKAWRTTSSLAAHLADIIPGVRVVKGFSREQEEHRQFERRSKRLLDQNMAMFRMRASVFPYVQLVSQLSYTLLVGVGGYMAIKQFRVHPELLTDPKGQNTIFGTLFMFTALLWRLYDPIGRLSRMTDQVQRATTSAQRVFELLDAFPDVTDPASPTSLNGRVRGRIEFRDVSFSYDPSVQVLRKVSLDIAPGEMVGIVGHSGVGKSTLASLLLRFYDPDGGQVLLDGVDLRQMSGQELRGNIGLVLQEPTLFHGSVLDNIRYGKPDATPEEVLAAAKIANAHRFVVRLPEGYDTQIGERGVRLSQGEKQRISIARAILRDPRILVLDEATASVDTETERLIQAALDRLIQGRTVLAIAHRLSTLRNADRIVVLADGGIAEVGSHDALLARQGLYYELCQAQAVVGREGVPSRSDRSRTEGEEIEPISEFGVEEAAHGEF